MSKYRKKPIVIEAFKWTGGPDQVEDPEWIIKLIKEGKVSFVNNKGPNYSPLCMQIETLEGIMTAQPGDYIIKGVQGEVYPCKPDIFKKTYEKV